MPGKLNQPVSYSCNSFRELTFNAYTFQNLASLPVDNTQARAPYDSGALIKNPIMYMQPLGKRRWVMRKDTQ